MDEREAHQPEAPPPQDREPAILAVLRESRRPHPEHASAQELARGGMGRILEFFDPNLQRFVAMKVSHDVADADGPSSRRSRMQRLQRFLDEARLTAQLDHPGVVPVHELGLGDDGQPFFTMRKVEGLTLRKVLDQMHAGSPQWSRSRVLGVMMRVCETLSYAHANHIIHRDLKPANVMVGAHGEVYVMDWGLARDLAEPDSHDLRLDVDTARRQATSSDDPELRTMDGLIVGTLNYMPPEQARADGAALDARSDVYSIGAMLYELLSGQPPYQETPGGPLPLLARILLEPPRALEEVVPDAPMELVAICEKAMARLPADRYEDVRELAEDLRAHLETRVVQAYTTRFGALQKWIQRNTALAVSLAASLLLATAGALTSATLARAKNEEIGRYAASLDASNAALQQNEDVLRRNLEQLDRTNRRLADLARARRLHAEADELWPADPERIAALARWGREADELIARLPEHEAELERLRATVLLPEPLPALHAEERAVAEQRLALLQRRHEQLPAGAGAVPSQRDWTKVELEATREWLDRLREAEREAARTEQLRAADLSGPYQNLRDLVREVRSLADERLEDMRERLAESRRIEARTVDRFLSLWLDTIDRVRESELYLGLRLREQVGLVPIGPDPDSGLEEFWHVRSGPRPRRDRDGGLKDRRNTGVVLVLIPPGEFVLGASSDRRETTWDPRALHNEYPPQRLELGAYLISKYELTQGQWAKLTGDRPSHHSMGKTVGHEVIDFRHPVEDLSWAECMRVLPRYGLRLPTEAEWERAARAGTHTPVWAGAPAWELQPPIENVAERWSTRLGEPARGAELWSDGYRVHAPVGSFRPNPFGLHDVLGNVAEWCEDTIGPYSEPTYSSRHLRLAADHATFAEVRRAVRGGHYALPAADCRVSRRESRTSHSGDPTLGVRPVWILR